MKRLFFMLMVILISASLAQAFNLFGKKNMGFRFEDYDNAEEVQSELLRLHPVGSDINTLKKTLEDAGSQCLFTSKDKLIDKIENEGDTLFCSYNKSFFVMFTTEWRTIVSAKFPFKDKIGEIKVYKFFHTI